MRCPGAHRATPALARLDLASDPACARALAETGRRRIEERFEIGAVARAYGDL